MAPRRGGGGGGGGGYNGSRGGAKSEPQTDINALYGRADEGNSVFAESESIGAAVVLGIYLLVVLASLLITKTVKKPRAGTDYHVRFTWAHALQITGVFYVVALALQIARWALLAGSEKKVGRSFRIEENVSEVFMGVVQVLLVSIFARLCSVVLLRLVPKSGPDPELARFRKVVEASVTTLLACVSAMVAAHVALGFAVAKQAFEAYAVTKVWRLGDRTVATQLSSKALESGFFVAALQSVGQASDAIWDSLMLRFTTLDGTDAPWVKHRKVQIALEVTGNVLVLVLVLAFGIIAFMKRSIPNNTNSKDSITRHSATIVRKFLFNAFPSLLLSALITLGVSIHLDLHNFNTITSHSQWSSLRSRSAEKLDGWLPDYRSVFVGFPIVLATFKNLGWVVSFALLSILTRRVATDKKGVVEQELQLREARRSNMPYAQLAAREEQSNIPYAQLAAREEQLEKGKKKRNVSIWKWMWY